jgi:hypothetical protein
MSATTELTLLSSTKLPAYLEGRSGGRERGRERGREGGRGRGKGISRGRRHRT